MRICSSGPRLAAIGLLLTSTALALSNVPARADASCDGLSSAMLANTKVPYHSFSIITYTVKDAAKPQISQMSETISTQTAVFARFGSGKWKQMHIPLDKLAAAVHRSAESLSACKRLADDTVNGTTFAVYTGHSVTPNTIAETKVWVEPKRGVMVRAETDTIPNPPPAAADFLKSRHVATRYTYDNVVPPANAE